MCIVFISPYDSVLKFIPKPGAWMETFKQHARDKDAIVLFAGIGLGNPNGEDLPLYYNEEYLMEYNGIQVIDMNLN